MERVRSLTLCLEGGGEGIMNYYSVLKESIQLQNGVFYMFNIMFELWTSLGMMFIWTLVSKGLTEYDVANVGGSANVAAT